MTRAKGPLPESKETPAYEAKSHSTRFLKKAVRLSQKKTSKRR